MAPTTWNHEAVAEMVEARRIVRVFFATRLLDEADRAKGLGFRAEALVGGYRQAFGPVCRTEAEALVAVYAVLLARGASKRWPVRVCDPYGDRIGGFGWSLSAYIESDRFDVEMAKRVAS